MLSITKALSNFWEDVKNSYRIRKSKRYQNEVITLDEMKPVLHSKKGIPVYLHDDLLVSCGIPAVVPGAISGIFTDNSCSIVINNATFQCDPEFVATVITHEEGHLIMHHYVDKKWRYSLKNEYAADEYAEEQGHDVLVMLETAQRKYGYNMKKRIKNILNRRSEQFRNGRIAI